jgi:hypothetical protein
MDDNGMAFSPQEAGQLVDQPHYTIDAPEASQEETLISRTVAAADQLRARATRRLTPKRPLPRWAVPVIVAVLLAILLPGVVAAASAFQDYSSIKSLGQSGMRHLMNAKTDLSGMFGLTSNVSISSLLNGSTPPDAPYTLFVQRQGGTQNNVNVTIHPASNMPKSIKTATYQEVIATNTALTLGGAPAPAAKARPTPSATATPTSAASSSAGLDPVAINNAITELKAAQSDFQALRAKLAHPDWVLSLAPRFPGVAAQMDTATVLANVGYDAATLGVVLIGSAKPLVDRLHNASLAGNTELITQSDVKSLQTGLAQGEVIFNRIQQEIAGVQVDSLPVSAAQKEQLSKAIALMPRFNDVFRQASSYIGMFGWLAGADAPRNFLVQTLDKGELRGTGGFAGFFSILTIDHGKIGQVSLKRANDLDYGTLGCGKGTNNWAINNPAPPAYRSWWPFANFGLRDANLNSDFPTSAKIIMNAYSHEACSNVDGVIQFTPDAITSVLRVTGPLIVPIFNEKVTADNLEAKIHFYEESDAGIARARAILHDYKTDQNTIRVRFTQELERLLETTVRHLPKSEFVPLAKQFLADLRAKDVQIYFTNPALEQQLQKLGADGAIDKTLGLDGLFVSQVNVSVSKASPYVATTITDNVSLDTKGGATHHLQVAIKNNAQSYAQVAGFLTYRDYVRIYVPAGAQLRYADGFDSGKVMCIGPTSGSGGGSGGGGSGGGGGHGNGNGNPAPTPPTCGANPYPNGERVCPTNGYLPANQDQWVIVQPGSLPNTLNNVGWPTATKSDVPGVSMWGGYVVIPQYCTANLWLTYYVPNVVNKAALAATAHPAPTVTPTGDIVDPRRRTVA